MPWSPTRLTPEGPRAVVLVNENPPSPPGLEPPQVPWGPSRKWFLSAEPDASNCLAFLEFHGSERVPLIVLITALLSYLSTFHFLKKLETFFALLLLLFSMLLGVYDVFQSFIFISVVCSEGEKLSTC